MKFTRLVNVEVRLTLDHSSKVDPISPIEAKTSLAIWFLNDLSQTVYDNLTDVCPGWQIELVGVQIMDKKL